MDYHKIKAVTLSLTRNDVDYFTILELKEPAIQQLAQTGRSFAEVLDSFSALCNTLNAEGNFSNYFIGLLNGDSWYKVSPVQNTSSLPGGFIDLIGSQLPEEIDKYNTLSEKEKEVLFLFWKHTNLNAIGRVSGLSVNTIKTHRRHIFKKLEFKSHEDLQRWCSNYLRNIY